MNRVSSVGGQIIVIDLTSPPDKAEMYNHVKKLRDPSHVKALTICELEYLFKKARIPIRGRGYRIQSLKEAQKEARYLLFSHPLRIKTRTTLKNEWYY